MITSTQSKKWLLPPQFCNNCLGGRHIKQLLPFGMLLFFVFFGLLPLSAQFNTPTINSDLGTDEYGASNANAYNNGTPTWYLTWNDIYLYINIQNANETEAGIVYFDITPNLPVNSTTEGSGGTTVGVAYDGLAAPNLPFTANAVIYFKNNYRELRRWNGSSWAIISSGDGGLGGMSNDYTSVDYSSNGRGNGAGSDDDRELRITWCRLSGGTSNCRPTSFNWYGYIAYSNGRYGQAPLENPGGTQSANTVLTDLRYFTVTSTTDGNATNPTSRNCYTHPDSDNASFGAISVYNFTMNRSGRTITRSSGDWTISGNL